MPNLRSMLQEHWQLARTLRSLSIRFEAERCIGDLDCCQVCPVGCWRPEPSGCKAALIRPERCIACGACVLQCSTGAIELR